MAWSEFLLTETERVTCTAVWLKPRSHWRPQNVADARNVKYLFSIAVDNSWSQSKREACGLKWANP
jgi:hypothetical protein